MAFPAARPVARAAVPAAVRLLRPGNALLTAAAVGTGAYVAAGPAAAGSLPGIGLAALAGFACAGAGNALNDLRDVAIDREAHPNRPLVTGALSERAARGLVLTGFAVGLAAAFLAGVLPGLLAAGAIAALLAYEFALKTLGLPGNVAVALLTGLPFVLGAVVVGEPLSPAAWVLALLATAASLGREIVKDVQDMASDAGRATLPRRHGARRGRQAAAGAFLLAVAFSPLALLVEDPLGLPYLALVVPADLLFAYAAFTPEAGRASVAAKGAMVVGLAAFVSGRWAA